MFELLVCLVTCLVWSAVCLRYIFGLAFPINAYCRPHRDPTIQKNIYYDSSYDDVLEIIRWIRLIILISIVLDSYYNGLPATETGESDRFSDRSPEGGASSLQILVSNHHMVTIYLSHESESQRQLETKKWPWLVLVTAFEMAANARICRSFRSNEKWFQPR